MKWLRRTAGLYSLRVSARSCGEANWKCCKVVARKVARKKEVRNTVTGREYSVVSGREEELCCKTEYVVYLAPCQKNCVQYIGSTTEKLSTSLSGNRACVLKEERECFELARSKLFHNHVRVEWRGWPATTITPLDAPKVRGSTQEERIAWRRERERELFWIGGLWTAYPCGLNEELSDLKEGSRVREREREREVE